MIMESTVEPVLPLLQAVGKIPSGLFIATAGRPGSPEAVATIVSFVQQLSFEPLCIGLAIKKGRPLALALAQPSPSRRRFVLNITHAGDKTLLRRYAKSAAIGPQAFDGVAHRVLESGQAVLLDACAYVECELLTVVDFGADHDLFIGRSVSGDLLGDGAHKPIVHIRHDASRY